ncbi:hypothetical protein EDC96DRAFT_542124 [Choanephora cucurbitarum]|nr:hypothetical protein EDC96DRAFT_542124 [Choanephora cucurbitarum]
MLNTFEESEKESHYRRVALDRPTKAWIYIWNVHSLLRLYMLKMKTRNFFPVREATPLAKYATGTSCISLENVQLEDAEVKKYAGCMNDTRSKKRKKAATYKVEPNEYGLLQPVEKLTLYVQRKKLCKDNKHQFITCM